MSTFRCSVAAAILAFSSSPALPAQQPSQANALALLGPPPGQRPVVVRAGFHLQDINAIDDGAETFDFTGVLTLTWRDPRQAFDPVEAQTEERIFQGEFQFNELSPAWYPQVVLVNESGTFEKHGTLLRVQPDGTSTLIETVNAVAKTDLDMRRYPFDEHQMEAVFEVLGFDEDEVVLEASEAAGATASRDVTVPQWRFVGVSTRSSERAAPYASQKRSSSTFVVSVDVRRRSFFVVRLVFIPLVLIVMLSWSVFWMDRSSLGDRIGVSFIGILTAVAYQNVVGDIMPPIAYMTFTHGVINFSLLTMCASVVINLVVGELDKRGRGQIGDLVDRRCRRIFPAVYFGLLLLTATIAFLFL